MQDVEFQDLGKIEYEKAWKYQECLFDEVVSRKLINRDLPENERLKALHYLIFCEHPHVYTLGKSGSVENLLLDEAELKNKSATFFNTNRGGDITYHGPGQIVGYPILDLDCFFTDIGRYLRTLEEAVILTLGQYEIKAERREKYTGVWLDGQTANRARKICAIGVRCSRWVTMHGFAFNVNTDLSYFGNIVPCGIENSAVTSMEKELGVKVDITEVKTYLLQNLGELFKMELIKSKLK